MQEGLVMWVLFAMLVIWREVSCKEKVQRRLHREDAKARPWMLQWYTITFVFLSLMMVRTFLDVVRFDLVGYKMLTSPQIERNIEAVRDSLGQPMSEEEKDDLAIPNWLRKLAVFAPFASVFAFSIIALHFVVSVRKAHKRKAEGAREVLSLAQPHHDFRGAQVMIVSRNETGTIVKVDVGDGVTMDETPYKVQPDEGGDADWMRAADLEPVHKEQCAWFFEQKDDLVLLVIIMPAFFIVMALRAEIRVLQIMTGDRWASLDIHPMTWEDAKIAYRSMYTMDLELASAFQFLTVWAFARLCSRHFNLGRLTRKVEDQLHTLTLELNRLRHRAGSTKSTEGGGTACASVTAEDIVEELRVASAEQHSSLVWAGLQGIWAYIVVGSLRALFDLIIALLRFLKAKSLVSELQTKVLNELGPVFAFTAALCVYNSLVVFRMKAITDPSALGKWASLKFLATRALLLIGQFQPLILGMASKNLSFFSECQAMLVNAALLNVWCLPIALFNLVFFSWRDRPEEDNNNNVPTPQNYVKMQGK